MNENATLRAIRRRWWIIVLFAMAGAVLGALPAPAEVEQQDRTFTGTHTLLVNEVENESDVSVVSPNQVTLFVSTGEVPRRAAAELDFDGNPASLAAQVFSEFDFSNGALTISSTGTDPARVEEIANTFADELTSYLAERQDEIYQARFAASLDRLSSLENELTAVTSALAGSPDDPILLAQQGAISRRYSLAFEQSETLDENPPVVGFTTLQRAQAVEVTERGLGAPQSRMSRGLLAGAAGAALGFGVAVLLGLLDRRLRTQEQAEEVIGLRARVLIPKVKDKDRDQLVVRPDRHDALSDAYRTIRNLVAFVNGSEPRDRAPITLVVSPSPGDGKTSLSANLAAASAESGQRTILINADFRRPRLSSIFAPHVTAPLPFLLEDIEGLNATTLLSRTGVDRLRILDLTSVDSSAINLVRASSDKLSELSRIAETVIIDSSPVGATAEVLDLVPHADVIVMVARIGHTTTSEAQRAISILQDLTTAPILLVLTGLKSPRSLYDEYSDESTKPKTPRSKSPLFRRSPKPAGGEWVRAVDPLIDPTNELEPLVIAARAESPTEDRRVNAEPDEQVESSHPDTTDRDVHSTIDTNNDQDVVFGHSQTGGDVDGKKDELSSIYGAPVVERVDNKETGDMGNKEPEIEPVE